MIHNKKTYSLTIYLIKEEYSTLGTIVKKGLKNEKINGFGDFYYQDSSGGIPKWCGLFEGHEFPLFSSSASGLFVTKIKNRYFAITFGPQGRYYLNQGVTEERFGLITTLNSVKEKSIRSIDTKTLESEGLQTRIQSARPVSTDVFGFDVEKDLLRSVVGESEDERLGNVLAGRDSLRASIKCNLNDLAEKLELILTNYKKDDYKKKFRWIDNLKEIKDPAAIDRLNDKLIDEINKDSSEKVWLTVPEIIDWSDHGGFKYSSRKKDLTLDDVHIKTFKESLGKKEVSVEDLVCRELCRFTQSNECTKDQWRIYDCIYFEYSEGNETYFLTGGKWYAVNNNLVKEVNSYYENVSDDVCGIVFPDYNHSCENDYNNELAKRNKALLVDGHTLQIEGRSSFEFCDVYTKKHQLIHVKRYSGSSALSHLFNQGYVSCDLLLDIGFRKNINKQLLEGEFKIEDEIKRPNTEEGKYYSVVFCVVSKSDRSFELPFFSKLTLMHVAKSLNNWGYSVSLVKIKNIKPDKNDEDGEA